MSGKLIADLRKQVEDLTRYIQDIESGKELVEVTISIGDNRVSQREHFEGFDQLIAMCGELLMNLGLERDDYVGLLDDEIKAQLRILRNR